MLCRAAGGGDFRIDRRDVLAGLTGVAAAGLGAYPNLAVAADTKATVTDKLLACDPRGSADPLCPPQLSPVVVNFTPPTGPIKLVKKYNLALTEMKKLPATDPRSFASQAAIHEAYCDGHYRLLGAGDPDAPFDVHFSRVFAPWHRMYIYFYERILGGLIGDDTFALPYWNWDAPAGMALPQMFKDCASPLYDTRRNQAHLDTYVVLNYIEPPEGGAVQFDPKAVEEGKCNEVVKSNLATMYNQMIKQGQGAENFLGKKFSPGVNMASGTSGALETYAHTGIHIWLGDPNSCTPKEVQRCGIDGDSNKCETTTKWESGNDMGFLGTAARDPVFYSHHANVDRLWHIWANRNLGQKKKDEYKDKNPGQENFKDPEWLDTSFVFYDEKPQLVRVTVRDFLDAGGLGYRYEGEDEKQPWEDCSPDLNLTANAARVIIPNLLLFSVPPPEFPLSLTEGQNVELPSVARPTREEEGKQQLLVFDAVEFNPREKAKFDVAINVPPEVAGDVGPRCIEYAGSFASLPRGGHEGETKLVVAVDLPLDDVLDDIGVGNDDAVNVVIVPRTQGITIKSAPRIESRAY